MAQGGGEGDNPLILSDKKPGLESEFRFVSKGPINPGSGYVGCRGFLPSAKTEQVKRRKESSRETRTTERGILTVLYI